MARLIFAETWGCAKDALIEAWTDHLATQTGDKSTLILAHTRADVRDLNLRAREILKGRGELVNELGIEVARELAADDGTITIERGQRDFATGDRVMFLKNDRELGVRNGSLGTVEDVTRHSMRVTLDGLERASVAFMVKDYASLDYGYAATVHKAQGVTVDKTFVLATPSMDRHLAYVGMTRHRDGVEVYAGRDEFKSFDDLKERLSRARPKDMTLDYVQRRGLDVVTGQEKQRQVPTRERSVPEPSAQPQLTSSSIDRSDPIARFKEAQKEFIQVAGIADFDNNARARAAELRLEMESVSKEIAKDPARMREAEREGIAPQVKNFTRQVECEVTRAKDRSLDRGRGLER